MITKEQAIKLGSGELREDIHYSGCRLIVGPRGGKKYKIERWRVNGKCQTWVTRPSEFRLPIKYGLKTYHDINQYNCTSFHLASDCPLDKPQEIINETL